MNSTSGYYPYFLQAIQPELEGLDLSLRLKAEERFKRAYEGGFEETVRQVIHSTCSQTNRKLRCEAFSHWEAQKPEERNFTHSVIVVLAKSQIRSILNHFQELQKRADEEVKKALEALQPELVAGAWIDLTRLEEILGRFAEIKERAERDQMHEALEDVMGIREEMLLAGFTRDLRRRLRTLLKSDLDEVSTNLLLNIAEHLIRLNFSKSANVIDEGIRNKF